MADTPKTKPEATAPDPKGRTPALIIRAVKDGFRRCGMAHPNEDVEHPAGTFTEAQLAALMAEPGLMVTVITDPSTKK
ncbi:HI1506-related protein [Sneathiella sp.]|uniref:HI1506-related protein n=1 Tax=Sneathiella sp. TaxID=1964365 RepID=UPI002FE1C08B